MHQFDCALNDIHVCIHTTTELLSQYINIDQAILVFVYIPHVIDLLGLGDNSLLANANPFPGLAKCDLSRRRRRPRNCRRRRHICK